MNTPRRGGVPHLHADEIGPPRAVSPLDEIFDQFGQHRYNHPQHKNARSRLFTRSVGACYSAMAGNRVPFPNPQAAEAAERARSPASAIATTYGAQGFQLLQLSSGAGRSILPSPCSIEAFNACARARTSMISLQVIEDSKLVGLGLMVSHGFSLTISGHRMDFSVELLPLLVALRPTLLHRFR
jgi:hypothetical protein